MIDFKPDEGFSCWDLLSLDSTSPKTEDENIKSGTANSIEILKQNYLAWNMAFFNNCHFNFGRWLCSFQSQLGWAILEMNCLIKVVTVMQIVNIYLPIL